MRTTFQTVMDSRIPASLGLCSDSAKLLALINEAQERLLTKGKWHGTFGKFRICVADGCVTLPAQLATIEAAAICGQPIRVHDSWFEFLENGFGTRNGCSTNSTTTSSDSTTSSGCGCGNAGGLLGGCGMGEALYRGRFPTFKDIIPTGKLLNFICDLASDVGKTVLALGYDDNGNWIRTDQGGSILDGEVIAFAQGAGTNSVNNFSCVTDLQLPDDMDGQSWLYEYKVSDATKRMIGKYEYFETKPAYARYLFPSVRTQTQTDGTCARTAIEIMGKLEYIPAKVATDYLVISSIPALKEMTVAISQAEKEPDSIRKAQIIAAGYAAALQELDSELDHYSGSVQRGITVVGASVGSSQLVDNLL